MSEAIRVLHVDDEPGLLDLSRTLLERHGLDVATETAVPAALDRLEAEPFDCVVSDYQMPRADGLAFLAAVRERWDDIPFILFTGQGSEVIASDAMAAGVTDYLRKEVGTDQYQVLANRIERAVNERRVEHALAESQRRLSTLIGNLPGIVYRCDNEPDWPMEYIDGNVETVTGYSADAIQCGEVSFGDDLIHPADRERLWGAVQAALDAGEPFEVTYRIERADGGVRWLWERGQGVYALPDDAQADGGREVVAVEGFITDVTDRREREQALTEYKRLYSAVFNDPVSFIGVVEPDGALVRANETAMSFIDAEPEDVAGAPFWETPWWHSGEAVAALRDALERAREGEFVRFETVNHDADGEPIWLDTSIRPVHNEAGEVVRIIAEGRDVTDRKENERELARYETIVEATGDLVYVLDTEGRVQLFNDAAEAVVGYEPSDVVGEHVSLVMAEGDVETGRALLRSLLFDEVRTTGTFEMTLTTADDERIPCETHVSLLFDPDGEFAGSVGVIRDISERVRRDTQLRQLHEASRELVEADTAATVAAVTAEAASDILGYPINTVRLVEEGGDRLAPVVVSARTRELFGERDPWAVDGDSPTARAFRTGQPLVVEEFDELAAPAREAGVSAILYVPLGTHGTLSVASLDPAGVDDAALKLVTILAANAGVALDRLAEHDALETERDHLAALFRNIPDPTIRVEFEDGDPIVQDANPAFEEVFGFSRAQVLGRSVDEFIVPDDQGADAARYNAAIQRGENFHGEVRRRTANDVRDFIVHVVPHTVGARSTQGYAIYTDITDQKSRERELERQNERLEEFASVVSHDLRNPLNVAQGHTQLTRETGDHEHFEAVQRAHRRMNELITGLLALSRQGQALGETQPVDIEAVLDVATGSVEGPNAKLRLADPPVVEADPHRLSQLFENLLANAVAHVGHEVTVEVGPLDDGFYVADDGPGIPADERERVFESGYSGGGGTGFGLPIVRQIAEAHGWTLTLTESDEGGARFEFTGVTLIEGSDA
jgi:PAS domain S-box-containing protein